MRIFVFANGSPASEKFLTTLIQRSDRVFAADGGAARALDAGIKPHVVVGDFDSLAPHEIRMLHEYGARMVRHPIEKDQTDLELTLLEALKEDPEELFLLTALGQRLDQTLANIFLLTRPEFKKVRVHILDESHHGVLLHSNSEATLKGNPGDALSLVPLSPVVQNVSLEGTKWTLDRAEIRFGDTLTISNSFNSREVIVAIGEGVLLALHIDKKML